MYAKFREASTKVGKHLLETPRKIQLAQDKSFHGGWDKKEACSLDQ